MRARAWAWWLALGAVVGARELDPAACAARFDVQRDKIIRTEESREMGARYLSELDVGARAECLRLCCETDSCDVFVYEEKGPGSCYLFKCGPPEDFRCKFTAHGNFSSGVLALSRTLAELQDQEQRAHRESELASLRSATSPAPSTSTTTAAPPSPPPQPLPPQHPPPGRCSRYQFECRRGRECIAVYNACDGVPQCADGSDEAPELGCPPPPPAPPRASAPPYEPLRPQDSSEVEEGFGTGGVAAAGDRWPHRLVQAQPQHRHGAESGSSESHIFSHKGGLLQEAEGAAYAPFEPPAPWPRRAWPQPPGPDGAWGAREWAAGPRRGWPVPPRGAPAELPAYIPPKTMPEVTAAYSGVRATLRDSAKKGPPETRAPPEPPAPDLREEPRSQPHQPLPDSTHKEKPAPRAPAAGGGAAAAAGGGGAAAGGGGAAAGGGGAAAGGGGAAAGGGGAAAERHLAADEHDGLSEHPPAAVLLLVLGVLLTAALGGAAGCRARAGRRRRARPLAHDADYLVNGMYL